MVPIILDKSTFQSFSSHEHIVLSRHTMLNLIPILPIEVIGDLAKDYKGKALSADKVRILSDKFGGSSTPMSAEYRFLCMNALIGNPVPMTGQIIAAQSTVVPEKNGEYGVLIENTPLNYALLRWAKGDFSQMEIELAKVRRNTLLQVDVDAFKAQIDEWDIVLPRVTNFEDIPPVLDEYCNNPKLQGIWIQLLLRHINPITEYWKQAWRTWKESGMQVWEYAPYAGHCLRVILAMQISVRSHLVRWEPNNISDAQYLHYLPFCSGFYSNDKLHLNLAPLLAREDQLVASGTRLKSAIKRSEDIWSSYTNKEKTGLRFALGSHPIPLPNSTLNDLWDLVCRPWSRGSGNRAIELTQEEKLAAWELVEKLNALKNTA